MKRRLTGSGGSSARPRSTGIYVTISPYWAANTKNFERWGDRGLRWTGRPPGSCSTFDEDAPTWLQSLGRRPVYPPQTPTRRSPWPGDPGRGDHPGPETRTAYSFWSTMAIKPPQQGAARPSKFAAWLGKKVRLARGRPEGLGRGGEPGRRPRPPAKVRAGRGLPDDRPARRAGWARRVADEVAFYGATPAQILRGDRRLLPGPTSAASISSTPRTGRPPVRPCSMTSSAGPTRRATVIAVNRYYNGGSHVGDNRRVADRARPQVHAAIGGRPTPWSCRPTSGRSRAGR